MTYDISSIGTIYKHVTSSDDYKQMLKPYTNYLYSIYKIPICDITCDLCRVCNKSSFDGRNYQVPGKSMIKESNSVIGGFYHFK